VLLDASPLDPRSATFVDLGAGMGRVVLLAARRPFRQLIGVEVSPALVEIARENISGARDPLRVAHDIRIVRADAAAYALPRGPLVVYLYNPFHGPVFAAVLERLREAGRSDDVIVLYHTPVDRAVLEATESFERIADLGFGVAYRVRR
jgi:SAM-dependent methyltransferase